MIREIVQMGDVAIEKISYVENLADYFIKTLLGRVFYGHKENLTDSFIKTLLGRAFDGHKDNICVKCVPNIL